MDFLPQEEQQQQSSATARGEELGGNDFRSGRDYFIDSYNNHLDAHKLFSTPPLRSEFNKTENYEVATQVLSEETVKNKVRRGNWYGENTDFEQLINGYTSFQDPELLESTLNDINAEISQNMFSGLEKPKMNINDRFGIFSYDLASMAMNFVYDYYLKSNGEKVDADFVEKVKGKFYYLKAPKGERECEQKIRKRENGTPVVYSSIRKCYIDFERQEREERSVEIIVLNGFHSGERSERIIYNSMASIAVAKNLILKGFKVKITSLIGTSHNGNYFHLIPVKSFNAPLDINAVAYVCGDPRFYRYQGFKMLIKGFDIFNNEAPYHLGSPFNDINFIAQKIEEKYVPNSTRKQADTRLYFGGSRSLDQAKQEVDKALEILTARYGDQNDQQ